MPSNIHIRINDEKKQEIVKAAKREGLSITAFIITAINERLSKCTEKGRD